MQNYEALKKLYHEPSSIEKLVYDFVLSCMQFIFSCFFREIRTRGAFRIPRDGPVIFVAAPHANQFVDPLILQMQIKRKVGRRVSFLIAEKSYKKRVIGDLSHCQLSIPVKRAQDNLKSANGTIKMDPADPLHILGDEYTTFTSQCQPKGLLALPNSLGVGQIGQIIGDHELYLRKPFRFANDKARSAGEKLFVQGTPFKTAAKVDQAEVYAQVFEHLARGNCLGVFSEGGSHDRPDLLPLKAGVAIMALGAMDANPGCSVKIVPCGMNYFHADRFRPRAVVEFGPPIVIPKQMVDQYANSDTSRDSVRELLDIITKALKAVTVTCPDFETLLVVQTARRLYSHSFSTHLSPPAIVEMNRRLLYGYTAFQSNPRIQKLRTSILHYNQQLRSFNIPDHLVEHQTQEQNKLEVLMELASVLVRVGFLGTLALPGSVLFLPVFATAKIISERKRKAALAASTVKIHARDVIATWKILVGMLLAPLLYTFYSLVGTYILRKYCGSTVSMWKSVVLLYLISASITYSALIFGDRGADLIRSVKPLRLMLVNNKGFAELQLERKLLAQEITSVINEYGPQLYPDFNLNDYKDPKLLAREAKYANEDEYEEAKTQQLRRRRARRKASKKEAGPIKVGEVPILQDDSSSSGIGLSSSSSSEAESLASDSEYEGSSSGFRYSLNLVHDKIIDSNRKREG